jgi:hypothetical protein
METVAVETLASVARDRMVGVGNRTILDLPGWGFNDQDVKQLNVLAEDFFHKTDRK